MTEETVFSSLKDVLSHLNADGYTVARSTIYLHQKEGKIRPNRQGNYTLKIVQKYADRWLSGGSSGPSADTEALQQEKLEAETRKLKAQAEHWQMRTEIQRGIYIERDAFERELAARALIFRQDIENFFRARAAEIIRICNGDQTLSPELIEYCLDAAELWMDRYSEEKKEWQTIEEEEETDE